MSATPETTPELNFTPSSHSCPSSSTDPCKIVLPPHFTVLILGAPKAIGAAIALCYAKAGASTLVLTSRDVSSLSTTRSTCLEVDRNLTIHTEACNIASSSSVAALAETLRSKLNRLDAIIVNSGYSGPVILDITKGHPEDFKRALDINVLGTYHVAHYLLPLLFTASDSAKAFIAISSAAAWLTQGMIANTGYCISKLAQTRLVEMVSKQYQEKGLFAVAVHPGAVQSDMSEGAPEQFKQCESCCLTRESLEARAYQCIDLTDSVDLCGAFCVWLTKDVEKTAWLSGRFLSADWDVDELMGKKEEILNRNLLRAEMTT